MSAHFPLISIPPMHAHLSPSFLHRQSESSLCSTKICLQNASIFAALSELSTGPQASDVRLAVSAWHSSSHLQSLVIHHIFQLAVLSRSHVCILLSQLSTKLENTSPVKFQSLNALSSTIGYILLPGPQLRVAFKHFYRLRSTFSHTDGFSHICWFY